MRALFLAFLLVVPTAPAIAGEGDGTGANIDNRAYRGAPYPGPYRPYRGYDGFGTRPHVQYAPRQAFGTRCLAEDFRGRDVVCDLRRPAPLGDFCGCRRFEGRVIR